MMATDRNDLPERPVTGVEDEDFARGQREGVEPVTGDRGDYARGLDAETPAVEPDYARGQRDLPRPEDEAVNPPRGDFARGQRDDTAEDAY